MLQMRSINLLLMVCIILNVHAARDLCDEDVWTTIKGDWTYSESDGDCSLQNTDSGAGNIVWIGSEDGTTPDNSFIHDIFEFTVTLEVASGSDAGIMFECEQSSETNNEGPSYYVGLDPYDNEVTLNIMNNAKNLLESSRIANGLRYNTKYELSVRKAINDITVILDGDDIIHYADDDDDETLSGSIGLRTYYAPTTFYSMSYSIPTSDPTTYPTKNPTFKPTANPTPAPTPSPSPAPVPAPTPTPEPTFIPTDIPTAIPSSSPTTPAPTHPGELICGSHKTGDYNGEPITVQVRMPYDGDMTLDASASDFNISEIVAYDSNNNLLAHSNPFLSILTVYKLLHFGDYNFTITGADGVSSGTFDIVIGCESSAPTSIPTATPLEDESEIEDDDISTAMIVLIALCGVIVLAVVGWVILTPCSSAKIKGNVQIALNEPLNET